MEYKRKVQFEFENATGTLNTKKPKAKSQKAKSKDQSLAKKEKSQKAKDFVRKEVEEKAS